MPAPPGSSATALPTLDGPTVLDTADGLRGAVHALACDRLLTTDGPVWWVDAAGHADAARLAALAPSRRSLDRIQVARGFTPYQHHTLCRRLAEAIRASCRDGENTPALVVCPAVDALYRTGDLPRGAARRLLASAVAAVTTVADRYDCPVLLTRTDADAFTAPVDDACAHRLGCRRTRFGPRFAAVDRHGRPVDDGFETLTYDLGDGWVQTTFAYWRTVLERRHGAYDASDASDVTTAAREVLASGAY
jgi:hypothetical protein